MKKITISAVAIGLTLSFNALATSALDSLNIESIKQNMTTEQIQTVLDDWKTEQLSLVPNPTFTQSSSK
ncbi:hypothetical protein VIN01S_29200 [Vibrio inusitatus NBRC 102082]|uniref:Uncharacterized protein n=1 Tax=Vibrio inusitatus NBRC 102082 TaxID=1219070 RepID=A0A4Y3HYA9_9VIBR|nr:hypothetical protein [Vibrio inusitatus]GEA52116.1 hypothetical protein VIN01S_29200 [Vibrio inusitatus NBRC 102082]